MAVYLRQSAPGQGWAEPLRVGRWVLEAAPNGMALRPDSGQLHGVRLNVERNELTVAPGMETVLLDGQPRIEPFAWRPGPVLQIGGYQFVLEVRRATPAAAPSTAPAPPDSPAPAPVGLALPPPDPPKWRGLLWALLAIALVAVGVAVWQLIPRRVSLEQQMDPRVRARAQASSVYLRAPDIGSEGSGYVAGRNLVITNAHVVQGATTVQVWFNSGTPAARWVPATITKLGQPGTPRDLATLACDTTGVPPLSLAPAGSLRIGAVITSFGFPLGSDLGEGLQSPQVSVHAGRISALRSFEGQLGWVESDMLIEVGNSGGPVVDLEGRVAGLATMIAGPNLRTALAASAEQIRAFAPGAEGAKSR